MNWFAKVFAWVGKAVAGPKGRTKKSTLVGMYLSQANSRDPYSSELQQNRTRRNGKFSHTRERA